ncbi:MAG: phosphoethanolamine--lipid A transferase [Gammaproteobacteria bacterium]|nr:phosphoethanolamine--lipid A transferase [Gammaproteobacteria bacterium]MCP5137495.1 phosphoethanolamine--lipid A transferase [Gammaproteobacteria bacterium]
MAISNSFSVTPSRRDRPWGLRAVELSLLFSAFLTGFYNHRFWQILLDNSPTDSLMGLAFVAASFLFIALWISLFVHLTSVRGVFKPLLIILLLIATSANYFTERYGVIIDKSMIQNVMQTDSAEATELVSGDMLVHLLLYFVLPAAVIIWLPIRRQTFRQEVWQRVLVYVASIAVMGGLFLGFNKDFTFLFRQHPELRSLITPTYPIHATIKYFRERNAAPTERATIGADAHRVAPDNERKTLFVLVVGETARAQNFGLNGYARDTTPELAKLDIVNFSHTEACGTSTAESLPCIFSHLGREDYVSSEAGGFDNLIDIVERAGIPSLWIDNQAGCKGVCERFEHINTKNMEDPKLCPDGECHDEIMIRVLDQQVFQPSDRPPSDRFVVLHQMGSHGPAYYRRIPDDFRRYTPECRSVNLQECSPESVVNSYDNTLLYTDHVLAELIHLLQSQQDKYDIALYFASDHGESLGENGLYLHGMPYLFAPEQQTRVPAILWLSQGYKQDRGISDTCLKAHKDDTYAHDNIFHTVLGALDIRTELYQAKLDMLDRCRSSIDAAVTESSKTP